MNEAKSKEESIYGEDFDENGYYIGEEEDEETLNPSAPRKGLKTVITSIIVVVLISQVLTIWPLLYNSAALEFLSKSRELSANEDIQQYKQAVVVVNAGSSKGTGFNISEEGYIITNHHVVDGESSIVVTFPAGEVQRAEVAISDAMMDIAILKVQTEGLNLPTLEIEEVPEWNVGDSIYFIGNPLVFNQIANEGTILGLTQLDGWDIPLMMIQAPIYKGNSGSPVINSEGKVIAVVFATTKTEYNGDKVKIGLAIPMEYIQEYLESF
jgi:serine protease Do